MVQTYQPLNLAEQLRVFRNQQFTGLVCFQSDQNLNSAEAEQYFISFLLGEVNYGGTVAPSIVAIADQLGEEIDHPFFKMGFRIARERAKGSDSPREVLSKVVSTRIVTWDTIESVMQSQAEATLRLIAQAPGQITSAPHAGSDLCFGDDSHGLNWSALEQVLENPTVAREEPASVLAPSDVATTSTNAPSVAVEPLATPSNLPTILSVDDSPIVQKMLQRSLSSVCHVLLAENALVALQILNQQTEISLILLDVNMPGINGLDFCRTIRGIPKFKNLPVIMLTANEGHISKAQGQIAGSTLYLTKPVDDQKLISIVRQYTQPEKFGSADTSFGSQASLSAI